MEHGSVGSLIRKRVASMSIVLIARQNVWTIQRSFQASPNCLVLCSIFAEFGNPASSGYYQRLKEDGAGDAARWARDYSGHGKKLLSRPEHIARAAAQQGVAPVSRRRRRRGGGTHRSLGKA